MNLENDRREQKARLCLVDRAGGRTFFEKQARLRLDLELPILYHKDRCGEDVGEDRIHILEGCGLWTDDKRVGRVW